MRHVDSIDKNSESENKKKNINDKKIKKVLQNKKNKTREKTQ